MIVSDALPRAIPQPFAARPRTVAHVIAEFLWHQGVAHVWGLTGSHIKPIWDEANRAGLHIVDVRHEAAAIHMAQAEADLTGRLAVATVTCGPGLTNAVTGIAAAYVDRSPLLVLSALPPRPQLGRGAFEHVPQVAIVTPVSRRAVTVYEPSDVLAELVASVSAAIGDDGPQGPAFIDVPIDVLRAPVPPSAIDPEMFQPLVRRPMPVKGQDTEGAAALIRASKRPLVISGRGTIGCAESLDRFLTAGGLVHLETKENRGVLPAAHPAHITALRGRSAAGCDLVVTVGRSLDYELAYGSRALFRDAPRFLRIGRNNDEVHDNHPGDVELRADVGAALEAMCDLELRGADRDWEWSQALREEHRGRVRRLAEEMACAPPGGDGLMHPFRLIAELNDHLDDESIVALDGGDIFSFARVGLRHGRCLGAGSLGCLGVAAPFAVSASLVAPHRRVVCLSGDGAFGFNALEISTAVRHQSRAVFVVANNAAWNIERLDQEVNFAGNVFGTELPHCRYDLLGASLGAHSEHVTEPGDLPAAFERAFASPPAVIDVAITRDALSPDFKSGLAELPDHQPLRSWEEAHRAIAAAEGDKPNR